MTKPEFAGRFKKAVEEAIKFARELVHDKIPSDYLLNLYYADRSHSDEDRLRLSISEAVKEIYRNGKIPTWVRVHVVTVDGDKKIAIIGCEYSDAFVNDDSKLSKMGPLSFAPFQISGPPHTQEGTIKDGKIIKKIELEPFDEKEGWLKQKSS